MTKRSGHRFYALLLAILGAVPCSVPAQSGSTGDDSGAQHRGPHGPPPEALQACTSKAAEAACSFSDRSGRPMSGTCVADTQGQSAGGSPTLACRPAGMQGGGDRPPPGTQSQ